MLTNTSFQLLVEMKRAKKRANAAFVRTIIKLGTIVHWAQDIQVIISIFKIIKSKNGLSMKSMKEWYGYGIDLGNGIKNRLFQHIFAIFVWIPFYTC